MQGTFVAGLVPLGEARLVREGLVEQPGDRTGTVVGRRGLQEVVSGRRTGARHRDRRRWRCSRVRRRRRARLGRPAQCRERRRGP